MKKNKIIIINEKAKDIEEINNKINQLEKMNLIEYLKHLENKNKEEKNEENDNKENENIENKDEEKEEESTIDDAIDKILKLGKYSKKNRIIYDLKFKKELRLKKIKNKLNNPEEI